MWWILARGDRSAPPTTPQSEPERRAVSTPPLGNLLKVWLRRTMVPRRTEMLGEAGGLPRDRVRIRLRPPILTRGTITLPPGNQGGFDGFSASRDRR
jgi:hypothetical protein